jgi:SAM-dependent methyltransferase
MQTTLSRSHLRLVASDGEVLSPPAGATLAERLLDFAGVQPGQRVIAFTYGPGRLAWRLVAAGCDSVSVDLAETPAGSIPEEWLATFDVAITACALHQVADPARLLVEVAACVRPGGVCAGLEPFNDDFASPDIRGCALSAGLSLFRTDQQTPSSALFWRAQVPAVQYSPVTRFAAAA